MKIYDSEIPKDLWGNQILIKYKETKPWFGEAEHSFTIISLGRDGEEGTRDDISVSRIFTKEKKPVEKEENSVEKVEKVEKPVEEPEPIEKEKPEVAKETKDGFLNWVKKKALGE